MLFKIILLTTFLTSSLYSAQHSPHSPHGPEIELPDLNLTEFGLLDPLEVEMLAHTSSHQDPYPVDPNFRWDLVFKKGKNPCLESDGCKQEFPSLAELVNHLKNSHELYYNPPATCSTICDADGSRISISYRTLWAYHHYLHQEADTKNKNTVKSPRKRKAQELKNDPDYNPDEKQYEPPTKKGRKRNLDPEKRIFTCDCGEEYNDRSSLKYHQQANHSNIDFSCPYCERPLAAQSSLLQHLRNVHYQNKSDIELVCKNGCKRNIFWPPILEIHEAQCGKNRERSYLTTKEKSLP